MALGVDVCNEDSRIKHIRNLIPLGDDSYVEVNLGDSITSLVPLGDGNYVVVDSCFDDNICQYETMVFPADHKGHVICWIDFDMERYTTLKEMRIGHKAMCEKWKKRYK